MSKTYNFQEVEKQLLSAIDPKTAYKSNPDSESAPFVTMMPPPNVTGALHIGHALVLTLQDILARYNRKQGKDVLWQAGVDHAGIATQLMIEKELAQEGLKKEDIGKEAFLVRGTAWKDRARSRILQQIEAMGASCDFSNIAFTMDTNFSLAVQKVFKTLYEEGLIYQDYRLVNWDSKFKSAISDLEVNYKEQKGYLYFIEYEVEGGANITIATTRPETMFGDTAVAVNPKDERYSNYVGKKARIPLTSTWIPIITDEYCDVTQGSGAVKITPAHDFNDFEVGKRHDLPLRIVIGEDGKLNENAPEEFLGLNVEEARKLVLRKLEETGALKESQPHIMQVPYGERSNVVIQPLPSKQWFLNVEGMAKEAISALKTAQVKFYPKNWENLYYEWLENIKPWCISRQLWWGHSIPAWHDEQGNVYVADNEEDAKKQAQEKLGVLPNLKKDESVLDTWFSSALWPFVTLGWPEATKRLNKYYPTSTLITGSDIIFFWVSRMIMMGKHFVKDVPFKEVYLHGLVLDAKGQKMSKTRGNVVDPLELCDEYGTDALRFTLASYASGGQNIRFSTSRLEGSRNFITKLWNTFNFLEHYECLDEEGVVNLTTDAPQQVKDLKGAYNQWLSAEFSQLLHKVDTYYAKYQFNEAANSMYHFLWDIYCDWYIELIKVVLTTSKDTDLLLETRKTASQVFVNLLHVLHPVIPFVTQHIFNLIRSKADKKPLDYSDTNAFLYKAAYPAPLSDDEYSGYTSGISETRNVINIVTAVRRLKALLKIEPKQRLQAELKSAMKLATHKEAIMKLARLDALVEVGTLNSRLFMEIIDKDTTLGLDLKTHLDLNDQKQRLTQELEAAVQESVVLAKRLSNPQFLEKAPADILEQVREQEKTALAKVETLKSVISKL